MYIVIGAGHGIPQGGKEPSWQSAVWEVQYTVTEFNGQGSLKSDIG